MKFQLKQLPAGQVPSDPFKPERFSPLRRLPTGSEAHYIRIDPAHTYAIEGIGKSYLASCIVVMARMNLFGNGNIGDKLGEAYTRFSKFCEKTKRQTSVQSFDHGSLKLPANSLLGLRWHTLLTLGFQMALLHVESRVNQIPLIRHPRLNGGYPAGLGKGYDAGVVGAWLEEELCSAKRHTVVTWWHCKES